MENQSAVETGGLRLPVGFRFYPTDEELVIHYLKRKAFNHPLPASIIPELDALRADPRDLPGDWKEKRYFFGNREWNGNKSRGRVVASGRGYWKPFGKETKVLAPGSCNMVLGFKRSLAFYQGKRLRGTKTPWVMLEFCLVSSKSNPNSSLQSLGDWVVHCVFQKKATCSRNSGPPQPSSTSCSSGVTVASTGDPNNASEQEESSRPCNGVSWD